MECGTVHNPSEQIREEDRVIREIRLPRETGPLFVSPGRLRIFVLDFEIRDSDLLFSGADAADAWLDYALVSRYLPPANI